MKPKKVNRAAIYDYHECRDYLQKKYGYNERDYSKHHDHFQTYEKVTGDAHPYYDYPSESNGKFYVKRTSAKRVEVTKDEYEAEWKLVHDHFKRFQQWEQHNPAPLYQDFWHWVTDNHEVSNGSTICFSREELEEIKEPWVRTIYGYYIEEFADEEGSLEMEIYW